MPRRGLLGSRHQTASVQLIRILDPLLCDHTGSFLEFADAVQAAIRTHLPALEPHAETILAYLVLYYGVVDGPGLTPPEDGPTPAAVAPVVRASAPASVGAGETAALQGTALDNSADGSALTVSWSKPEGPDTVTFADPHALATTATFSAPGNYVLRLTASTGPLSGHADAPVTVTAAVSLP